MKLHIRLLSPEEQDELAERFQLLTTTGKRLEGTSPSIDPTKRPDYFDKSRFDAAQRAINKNYLGVSMSSTVGLMLLLQLKEIIIPLLRTGKSRTIPNLYDRYSATALYMKQCYETQFYDPTSDGWRYITIVRGMHQRIFKTMNENVENRALIPECGRADPEYVWVNQCDMALTQFAFIGLFVLRPDECGASKISASELRDVIYFWRLLSHQFGIEDRFNLFVYHEDLAKQITFLEMIFDEYKRRLHAPRNPVAVEMAKGILLAFEDLSKDATINIIHNHWLNVISVTGEEERASYEGISELIKLARFRMIYKLAAKSDIARRLLVRMYKTKLVKFCMKGDRIKRKLAEKYPLHTFDLEQLNSATG